MRFREVLKYVQETPGNTNPTIFKQMVDDYAVRCASPLYEYTVDANVEDSVDLLGKKASDLQENVEVVDGVISGTLHYVTGYTGFSGKASEQEGHYLVLHYAYEGADSIKVNGVTLDSDGLHILIMSKKAKKIKIEIIDGEESITDYLEIGNLIFE